MKFPSLLLVLALFAASGYAQVVPESIALTVQQTADRLKPAFAAKGQYGLHVTNGAEFYQIGFFGTFAITANSLTLTILSSYDENKKALVPLASGSELFVFQSATLPTELGVKDGVVALITFKYTPTNPDESQVLLRVAMFNTGRLIGLAMTEAGEQFAIVGAPTPEMDYVGTFLVEAQTFHDAIVADKGEHASQFFTAWGQHKPLPVPANVQ